MKQQWLLLLAMVGMSLGASASASARYDPNAGYCRNCYVSNRPITSYCKQQEFQTACNNAVSDPNNVFPCGNSILLIGLEDCGDENSPNENYYASEYNCYYCWKSSDD